MPPSRLNYIIWGAVAAFSLSAIFYFSFWWKKTPQPLKIEDVKQEIPQKRPSFDKPTSKAGVVEDVEDDDEDSEEEDEEEEEEEGGGAEENANGNADQTKEADKNEESAELKKNYEDVYRIAKKCIDGNAHARAVEKLTEAIELAAMLPSARNDILSLYNNRSAMYEKLQEYNKSLSDIKVVLAMDPLHLKSRIRRARIYEQNKKFADALEDYIFGMNMERLKGLMPSNEAKIDSLAKIVAKINATAAEPSLRKSVSKALPKASICNSLLDSLPSIHIWREQSKSCNLDERLAELQALVEEAKASSDDKAVLERTLAQVQLLIGAEQYVRAFELLQTLPFPQSVTKDTADSMRAADGSMACLLATQWDLLATELQLRHNVCGAMNGYRQCLLHDPAHLDSVLKLAFLHVELGEIEPAMKLYDDLLAHYDACKSDLLAAATSGTADQAEAASNEVKLEQLKINEAWVYAQRSSAWFRCQDSTPARHVLALKDIQRALELSDGAKGASANGVKFFAHLKHAYLAMNKAQQLQEAGVEVDPSTAWEAVSAAKALFPTNDSVLLLEAEQLVQREPEKGIEIINELEKRSAETGDVYPKIVKAGMLNMQIFAMLENGVNDPTTGANVQVLLGEISKLYEEAMALDPDSVDALQNYAQFKTMVTGDLETAIELVKRAKGLVSNTEELLEVSNMLVMIELTWKTMKEIQTFMTQN